MSIVPRATGVLILLIPVASCTYTGNYASWPVLCYDAAPLHGTPNRAPGFIVVFKKGVDARSEALRLAKEYGFTAEWISAVVPGFYSRDLTESAVAKIRCELRVGHNGNRRAKV